MISMLIGLKLSSLACKCVFYKLEHNANKESHGTKFWRFWNAEIKHTNGRAQRGDGKNSGIYLFIIFAPESYGHLDIENGSFFIFSADGRKELVTVSAKFLSAPERSYWHLSENGMVNTTPIGFAVTVLEILKGEISKKLLCQHKNTKTLYF